MNDEFPVELKPKTLRKIKELDIKPEDIEEQFIRGSGHGGQKVNKTSSTVRLKHLPTGLEIRCQEHREQSKNRITAYKLLVDKIEDLIRGKESEKAKKIYKIKKQKKRRSKKTKEKLLKIKKQRKTKKELRKKVDLISSE
ncbi:peptide chain release factor-like protein [bacterium]|nr:peptide chain release factor-like protein [bacterium]